MSHTVSAATHLNGTVVVPADKSVAHRAALFAALSTGRNTIRNFPSSADPQSTLSCLKQLGVSIRAKPHGLVEIDGVGKSGLKCPAEPLDCGNSGTTMRLLAGILAGMPFASSLTGDASLSQRPMERIARPLRAMGARVSLHDGKPPIRIEPVPSLSGISYALPVPSAQVKSCVLLAGLWAEETTTVVETIPSRDHTERMLKLKVELKQDGRHIHSGRNVRPVGSDATLPGDFSSAAFFLVAGSIVKDAHIDLPGVGLNPTRTGLLDALRSMGANIGLSNQRMSAGEPVGDITVRSAELKAIHLTGDQIPGLIDEVPILAVAATCANGRSTIRGAGELRVKECDRIAATVRTLRMLGADIEEFEDGLAVTGGFPLAGAEVESFHDHRIAMAMAVAGLVASGTTTIKGSDIASVSFPGFWDALESLR